MRHVRRIRMLTLGALVAGAAACDPAMPMRPEYFEASFPPREPKTDWGRVDPELRAAGIRLHVDIAGALASGGSLDDAGRSLEQLATALERVPAGSQGPTVARAAQYIRERAQSLGHGFPDDETKRGVIKDALDTAVWAMLALAGYEYALDPAVRDRVARFREKVDAIGVSSIGVGRFDVYDALMGGRDALDFFQLAVANGKYRVP